MSSHKHVVHICCTDAVYGPSTPASPGLQCVSNMLHQSKLLLLTCLQGPGDYGSQAAIGLLQALIPALLMNICIVGMNQIFDVDIDKVNKPYLPLASGDWSLNTGISVAVSTGLVAVLLGLYIGSAPLLATLVGSLLLGIAYSVDLPFLRWKKYPVLAMGCILSVRYLHSPLLTNSRASSSS